MCYQRVAGKVRRRNRGVQTVHVLELCLSTEKLPNPEYFNL